MIGRMPVLACNYRIAANHTPVNHGVSHVHRTVAFWYRKGTAGTKIVLNINQ
jgi:hypothetical protein